MYECTEATHQPQSEQHEARWMAYSAEIIINSVHQSKESATLTFKLVDRFKNIMTFIHVHCNTYV